MTWGTFAVGWVVGAWMIVLCMILVAGRRLGPDDDDDDSDSTLEEPDDEFGELQARLESKAQDEEPNERRHQASC